MCVMGDGGPGDVVANSAARAMQSNADAVFASDWDTVRTLWAPDAVRDDRRRMGAAITRGIDALITSAQELVTVGFSNVRPTLVAVRGDRLALAHHEIHSPEGYTVSFLGLIQLDEQGLIAQMMYFDFEDQTVALAQLDAMHLAGTAIPGSPLPTQEVPDEGHE